MIILIAGDTHTGKTVLAQRLLEKYGFPYLSIDHLKMGLIRSGRCKLSATDEDKILIEYLWPIVREIIKTCIENKQNLIIEGCYIPFKWKEDFTADYINKIKYICLIFSRRYIENNWNSILNFENLIEDRLDTDIEIHSLIRTNEYNLEQCKLYNNNYILIDSTYDIDIDKLF